MSIHERTHRWWRPGLTRRWFFIPVVMGLIVLVTVVLLAPGPPRGPADRPVPLVRVTTVEPAAVTPTLTGYGEIRAEQTWRAVAQVPGRLVWRHERLRPGAAFAAGTHLAQIDPQDYELAVSRAESQQKAASAALAELNVRTRDLNVSQAIESEALEVAEREFQRRQRLAAGGHIAAVELDRERQQLLRQRQSLQGLEAQVNLLPAQRDTLDARVREAQLQLERARQDLERTRLDLPFTGRIVEVNAEVSQFVPAGQSVFTAATTDRLEALLEIPVEQLVSRFPGILSGTGPAAPEQLTATLTWAAGDVEFRWQGQVVRVDPALDGRSRAARVYIQVTDSQATPPAGNVFARIDLTGPDLPERLSVPRLAVEAGHVWLVNADDRLEKRPVRVAFRDDVRAVIADGVAAGDRVLLTRLPFATPGMAVEVAPAP